MNPLSPITDVNLWLGPWPARRLPFDETPAFVARLRTFGVTQAWVGSFEMLLHRDLATVNERLAAACKTHAEKLLIPFGAINPTQPDWIEDVRRCHEVHRMPGLRVTPNYHGYTLDHPEFMKLLAVAEERQLIVQLAVRLEDERTQPRLLRASDVDVKPLAQILPKFPRLSLMVLNGLHNPAVQSWLNDPSSRPVRFDLATLEGVAGIQRQLKTLATTQLCFGSYFPFFVWEAAKLKLRESELPEPVKHQILHQNATLAWPPQ